MVTEAYKVTLSMKVTVDKGPLPAAAMKDQRTGQMKKRSVASQTPIIIA
jgi:hypothetical protein